MTRAEYKQLSYAWVNMKQRCYNKKHPKYLDYGGRGITVCKEWINNKYCFVVWSLLNGFQLGLSLDRKNFNRGYTPQNCRWIALEEQLRNTRKNIFFLYNGERKCLSEWARLYGIPKETALYRYNAG